MKPIYQRIRDDIEARIMSGEWPPGHRVPFEHELMAIQDFALEASRAGTVYRFDILHRGLEKVDAAGAQRTGLDVGVNVLNVVTLHTVNDVPEAYEQRLINLATVPEVADERFEDGPPGTWLLRRVPWTDAEHVVRAINADNRLAKLLGIDAGAACLMLERRTWQAGAFVTEARITYPGDRHSLVGRFSPTSQSSSD